jgi:hypothetical protein
MITLMKVPTCMKSLSEDGEIPNLSSEKENKVLIKLPTILQISVTIMMPKDTELSITMDKSPSSNSTKNT